MEWMWQRGVFLHCTADCTNNTKNRVSAKLTHMRTHTQALPLSLCLRRSLGGPMKCVNGNGFLASGWPESDSALGTFSLSILMMSQCRTYLSACTCDRLCAYACSAGTHTCFPGLWSHKPLPPIRPNGVLVLSAKRSCNFLLQTPENPVLFRVEMLESAD